VIPLAEVGWALTDPGAQVVVFVGGIHGDSAHHVIPACANGRTIEATSSGSSPGVTTPRRCRTAIPEAVLLDVGLHGLDIFRSSHYTHREGEQAVVIIIES
jgi:hypothetical protein